MGGFVVIKSTMVVPISTENAIDLESCAKIAFRRSTIVGLLKFPLGIVIGRNSSSNILMA
jgi:hypothetical protein